MKRIIVPDDRILVPRTIERKVIRPLNELGYETDRVPTHKKQELMKLLGSMPHDLGLVSRRNYLTYKENNPNPEVLEMYSDGDILTYERRNCKRHRAGQLYLIIPENSQISPQENRNIRDALLEARLSP